MKQKILWYLNSWDRHKIPKPFTDILSSFANPLTIPMDLRNDQLKHYNQQLEERMNQLMHQTYDRLVRTQIV